MAWVWCLPVSLELSESRSKPEGKIMSIQGVTGMLHMQVPSVHQYGKLMRITQRMYKSRLQL